MREIVIDTETTGLDPTEHRIVEVGAVEMINRSLTGQTFHRYVCPQRAVPADAVAVHGLTTEFLADRPLFGAVADELLAFVGDAPLFLSPNSGRIVQQSPQEIFVFVMLTQLGDCQESDGYEAADLWSSVIGNVV